MVPLCLVVAAALVQDGRVLAARRSAPAAVAGGWEFPGGKVEAGESLPAALARECREELGVIVEPLRQIAAAQDADIDLRLWVARLVVGVPTALEDHDELRWLSAAELDTVSWLPIDRALLSAVVTLLE